MEQALYHPEGGYYSSGRAITGRGGDYFTNVSVGPLFGRLMTAQFAEIWALLGSPAEFTLVEQGASDGQFACDVFTAAARQHPAFYAALRYTIVEPFAALRLRQKETLSDFAHQMLWSDSLDLLEPFCGVHFSNELLDALPVHVVRWNGTEWTERHVGEAKGAFAFVDLPISDSTLEQHLGRLPKTFVSGYETEINLAAMAWTEAVARKLQKGYVIAVDYGFVRDEFHEASRRTGTLQCRARHQLIDSPLTHIGEADITAHVEWTSIVERAESAGLDLTGFTDQHHFITGLLAGAAATELSESTDSKTARQLQTLLHPGFLGMKFQFLVLGKNVEPSAQLSGLRFARDARATLWSEA
ncbi:MAG: SAM-dependent methyltransferase [Chthoniobacterales bacterium]|nr:SAM-dependent methyltransferase [Chthoniobacterales bacterium]